EVALEEALQGLHQAHDRLDNCRRWALALPREVGEAETPARQLSAMLEGDLRRAAALLEQKIRTLEEYVQITSGAGPVAAPEAAGPEPAPAKLGEGKAGGGGTPFAALRAWPPPSGTFSFSFSFLLLPGRRRRKRKRRRKEKE